MENQISTTTSSPVNSSARKLPRKARTARIERTPLKKICAQIKIDPKTARRVLRGERLAFHALGNRWELTAAEAKRVKDVLRTYAAS